MFGEESVELPDGLGELLKRVESEVVHAVDCLVVLSVVILSGGILLPRSAKEDGCQFCQILPVWIDELSHEIVFVLRPQRGLLHLA